MLMLRPAIQILTSSSQKQKPATSHQTLTKIQVASKQIYCKCIHCTTNKRLEVFQIIQSCFRNNIDHRTYQQTSKSETYGLNNLKLFSKTARRILPQMRPNTRIIYDQIFFGRFLCSLNLACDKRGIHKGESTRISHFSINNSAYFVLHTRLSSVHKSTYGASSRAEISTRTGYTQKSNFSLHTFAINKILFDIENKIITFA